MLFGLKIAKKGLYVAQKGKIRGAMTLFCVVFRQGEIGKQKNALQSSEITKNRQNWRLREV